MTPERSLAVERSKMKILTDEQKDWVRKVSRLEVVGDTAIDDYERAMRFAINLCQAQAEQSIQEGREQMFVEMVEWLKQDDRLKERLLDLWMDFSALPRELIEPDAQFVVEGLFELLDEFKQGLGKER